MVVIASDNIPRYSEGLGRVHGLKGFLMEETRTTETAFYFIFSKLSPHAGHSTDLKPLGIDAVHTSEVEVIPQGQNEVRPHLLRHFAHFPRSRFLHGGDVRRVRHPSPVAHSQEPDGGSVS